MILLTNRNRSERRETDGGIEGLTDGGFHYVCVSLPIIGPIPILSSHLMQFFFLPPHFRDRNDEGHREVAGILQSPGEWMVGDPSATHKNEEINPDDATNETKGREVGKCSRVWVAV